MGVERLCVWVGYCIFVCLMGVWVCWCWGVALYFIFIFVLCVEGCFLSDLSVGVGVRPYFYCFVYNVWVCGFVLCLGVWVLCWGVALFVFLCV